MPILTCMSPASDIPQLPHAVLVELGRTGDWVSSWWTVAALALVTLAVVVIGVRAGRRRAKAGRPRRRWVSLSIAAATALATIVVAGNAWVGYLPTLGAVRQWASVNLGIGDTQFQSTRPLGSSLVGGIDALTIPIPADVSVPSSTTWVYTPPGYDEGADPAGAGESYPVIFLAHGSPGTATDWFAAGDAPHILDVLIDNGVIEPMIAVSFDINGTGPGASDTQCLDSTTGGSSIETYLGDVVVPYVDANYATDGTRIIAGFSAGAFCALDQGLRHPETFAGMVAIAPYLDPGSGGHAMLADDAEFAAHDLRRYVPAIAPATQPIAMVLLEDSPADREAFGAMATQLRAKDHPTLLYEIDGDHTWLSARSVFPQALTYVAGQLGLTPVASSS